MDSYTLAFAGDITFNHYFSLPVHQPLLDQSIIDYLNNSDQCVGNIEGPFIHLENTEIPQFRHHSDCKAAQIVQQLGINIWNLANNHALDFESEGIKSSVILAKHLGCQTIGAGINDEQAAKPIIIHSCGGIGLFSVTYSEKKMKGINECSYFDWDDMERIKGIIQRVKAECRWCIMVVHGGEEFSDMPMPETRKRYISYLNLGVDIVVGHHPHVVQNYEMIGKKIIFYSLGNFIFDTNYQRNQMHSDIGEIIRITFHNDSVEWDHMPVQIDRINNRVIHATKDPAVFTNLTEKAYKRLWRYAAKGYYDSERKVRLFLNPKKYNRYSIVNWMMHDIKMLKAKKNRSRIIGRYLAWWPQRKDKEKEIAVYVTKNERTFPKISTV